jgi:hypothetical protein
VIDIASGGTDGRFNRARLCEGKIAAIGGPHKVGRGPVVCKDRGCEWAGGGGQDGNVRAFTILPRRAMRLFPPEQPGRQGQEPEGQPPQEQDLR